MVTYVCHIAECRCRTMGQSNQECKETSIVKFVNHVEKLELRFLLRKKNINLGFILGFAICTNKFPV